MGAAAAALAIACAWPGRADARAMFTINNLDTPGVGFNDARAAAPVGGNTGTTVGQQRMNVFREATMRWGQVLDSPVPIVIDANFGPLSCGSGIITLGQAGATGLQANRPGMPPNIYYPQPLAERLTGTDLNFGEADIEATFNGELVACSGGRQDWYYGFDGKPTGNGVDLLSTVLHELGHGLGFSSGVDDETGSLAGGLVDSFTAHIFDNATGMAWMQMTAAQRVASSRNARHLVWNGENVTRVAPAVLAKGTPRITVTPVVPGFTGFLAEANFGPFLSGGPKSGRLVVGSPADGCAVAPSYAGAIVLFLDGNCPSVQKTSLAQAGSAAGVLIGDGEGMSPPSSVEVPQVQKAQFPVTIPALGLGEGDFALLAAAAAGNATAMLTANATQMVGADEQGRVYLYASDPIRPGSTVSHWDPLARPSLIMEPTASFEINHDLRLEAALMRDIGWTPFCGNGRPDPDEQCDNGPSNSDTAPGACRTTCMNPRCGDGIVDTGEQCDTTANSDTMPGACRTTCMNPRCGDGVVDTGEQCDTAANNSDTMPGACRTNCMSAPCGNGVRDTGEQCDNGANNSDTKPAACRTTCMSARCGDGVLDPGEQCDDGAANAASAPCSPMCMKPSPPEESGCGCALATGDRAGTSALLLLAVGLAAGTRRRRRRI